jgi:hypothetical protein
MFASGNGRPHALHGRAIADLLATVPVFPNSWSSGIFRRSTQSTSALLASRSITIACDECPDTRLEGAPKKGQTSANHDSKTIDRQALTVDGV